MKEKNIPIAHDFGDSVYLKTDPFQYPRLITAIVIRRGYVQYEIASGTELSLHNAFELSATRDETLVSQYREL